MGFLTFDPERVALLARALLDVSRRLDSASTPETSQDIASLLGIAAELVTLQISRVESALRGFRSTASKPTMSISRDSGLERSCMIVAEAIERYRHWSDTTSHWWALATTETATESDNILRSFECPADPLGPGRLIDGLSELELVVLGTVDLSLVEALWMRATDPRITSPGDADRRIRRLLDIVFDERRWERGLAHGSIDPVERTRRDVALRDIAARIVAPWQLHLVRTEAEDPPFGSLGAKRLHQLSQLESASDTLTHGLAEALQLSLSHLPDDPDERLVHIDSVAHAVGTSLEVRRMSQTDRADAESGLDTLRNLIGKLALDGPWPISLLVDAGARWVEGYFDTSDEKLRLATLEQLTHREALATLAVLMVFTAALERTRHQDKRFRSTAPENNEAIAAELRHTYQSIDNASARGQNLAQLAPRR